MKKYKKIIIWCEDPAAFFSLSVFLKDFEITDVAIFTLDKHISFLKKYLVSDYMVLSIESHNSFLNRILTKAIKILTDQNFSFMYASVNKSKRRVLRKFLALNKFFISNKCINDFSVRVSRFFGFTIYCEELYSFSRINYFVILNRIMNSKHTTIIESWDHPVKAPFYYIPNQCIHWNSDLKQLAIEYQNFRNITHKNMFPLKFNYIDTLRSSDLPSLKKAMSKSELEEIEKLTKVKYIVYVCTTSSKNIEHPYRHNEECAFIEDLGITAREFGYLLYVKPKPNGVKGDYDHVMKNNSNIIVGVYSVNTDGTDTTRHGYHAFRKALVYNAEFVVNVASTFALEAALMGTRVAQVNLLGNNRYPHFSHYSRNLHVKKFLNNLAAFSITNKDMENLFLPEARDKMDSFVLNIKRWLGA